MHPTQIPHLQKTINCLHFTLYIIPAKVPGSLLSSSANERALVVLVGDEHSDINARTCTQERLYSVRTSYNLRRSISASITEEGARWVSPRTKGWAAESKVRHYTRGTTRLACFRYTHTCTPPTTTTRLYPMLLHTDSLCTITTHHLLFENNSSARTHLSN